MRGACLTYMYMYVYVLQLLLQQELIRRQQALALQQQNTGTSDKTVHAVVSQSTQSESTAGL